MKSKNVIQLYEKFLLIVSLSVIIYSSYNIESGARTAHLKSGGSHKIQTELVSRDEGIETPATTN